MQILTQKYSSQLFSLLPLMISILSQILATISAISSLPAVILPSLFHWDANNFVYVTPTNNNEGQSVDILLKVEGENAGGQKSELFSEMAHSTKGTHAFKVPVPRLDPRGRPFQNFYISIRVDGHQPFFTVLGGASDIRQIHLQTDKVFYRPEERVNIRALPLTSNAQIYKGLVQFQLLDPNGFRIFNKTNRGNLLANDGNVQLEGEERRKKHGIGFLADYFDLPKFLRFGIWRIVAFAVNEEGGTNECSSNLFQTTIRVEEYEIPKFHILMDLEEIRGQSPLVIMINVFSRFAHGMAVNGELTLRCAPMPKGNNITLGRENNNSIGGTRKLLTAHLDDGHWSGQVNLRGCAGNRQKIKIFAEVYERGTLQTGNTAREWDPFMAGFEMIPLRPAYTKRTQKLHIFLKLLSSLESVEEGRVELVSQCISEESSLNGLNHSLIQRLGTIVELEVENKCLAYIIRARRQLADGNFSLAETLVLPLLRNFDFLEMSLIEISPNQVDFVEGEVLEAKVNQIGQRKINFNFAFICNNGREVVVVDRVPDGGRILLPINGRMQTGPCVLYVYGRNGENDGNKWLMDMRLFIVRTEECLNEQYGLTIPRANLSVGAELNVSLKARPNSLATLHVFDSRLEALLHSSSTISSTNGQLWAFTEFLSPDPDDRTLNENFAWFTNFLDLKGLFARRKAICQLTGKLAPQCPVDDDEEEEKENEGTISRISFQKGHKMGASRFSEECRRELKEECERQKRIRESANRFLIEKGENAPTQPPPPPQEDEGAPAVKISGGPVMWIMQRPLNVQKTPTIGRNNEFADLIEFRSGKGQQQQMTEANELILRDFFPEVWLFEDFQVGENSSLDLRLNTPHSVTEWRFVPKFWSPGRADVCRVQSQSLFIQRDVFMDVDIFPHIYINETVPVTVTVSAENLTESGRRLAVCFRGLSPVVCGDVGRDGRNGETEFTRIELNRQNPVQQKRFFVRFLRQGMHNLSFELRAGKVLKGYDWHCRDGNIQVFDRIVKQIKVSRRVDLEEHYRQIVVYKRRKIEQPTLENILGEEEERGRSTSSTSIPQLTQHYWLLQSSPDVITYSQQQPLDDAEIEGQGMWHQRPVQTKVQINAAGRRLFNVGVEFSKFVASFPPALSTELLSISSPLSAHPNQLHRVKNRLSFNSLASAHSHLDRVERSLDGRKKKKKRVRKKMSQMFADEDRPLQGYSLPNLLKALAQTSYELKSLRALLTIGGGGQLADEEEALLERIDHDWMEARESQLGNLLAELLTFSDCQGHNLPCGFGEYIKPKIPQERNLVSPIFGFIEFSMPFSMLTTLATSLLCEQRASDEFVCGPIQYLAQSIQRLLHGSLPTNEWDLDSFVQFKNETDRRLFMEALMVQVALDCSAYSCSAEAWKRLHSSFYRSIDLNIQYDVRVIAALAYMSTAGTRSIMRSKLASRTQNDDQVPYWRVGNEHRLHNLLEKSFEKSSNVLVNALALLAYSQDQSIYRFWKNEFDLEAMANWLIEQQGNGHQYENALDTFFATRALHKFSIINAQREMRQALAGTINANYTVYSMPEVENSVHFRDQDLPFTLAIPPKALKMELNTIGESRLLLGVKVLMEKRKRSRRDPNESEPVTLSLKQEQNSNGFINQTVTLIPHSHLLRSIQIEHGLFTGFSSQKDFVNLLSGTVNFQMEPRVGPTAIHFVLTNLSRNEAVIYSVTLIEPKVGYEPDKLAPVSISALHHHLPLGELIVLPDELDFVSGNSRKRRRSISPEGHLFPSHVQSSFPSALSSPVPPPAHFQMANSFLTQLDNQQQQNSSASSGQQQFYQMIAENRNQAHSEVVETVCLQNGVCTCAELSCTLKCTSCDRLSFNDLCKEIKWPEGNKFVITFRTHSIRTLRIGENEYKMLENVQIYDWKYVDEKLRPEHLTILIRHCNRVCMRKFEDMGNPRFLLIGDPKGLFDESSDAIEGNNGGEGGGQQLVANAARNHDLLKTYYLMRDGDRLMRSTDCQELFGKISDEICTNENDGEEKNGQNGRRNGN